MTAFKPDAKKENPEISGFSRPFENLKSLLNSKSVRLASRPPEETSAAKASEHPASGYDARKRKSESPGFFRPFENLKSIIDSKSLPLTFCPVETISSELDVKPDHPEYEQKLFMKAMTDVRPLSKGKYVEEDDEIGIPRYSDYEFRAADFEDNTEQETLLRLKNLVEYGVGFVVADTPEYIEGTGYCDNPEITERLRDGEFSMQGYVDLHGFGVEAAQEVFDTFMRDAVRTGKRAVLIVHGRGLSSPSEPVLKTSVQDWLTRGPWRKWVIAFSSARLCDGGAGATYVLLRNTPFTKRFRKRHKIRKKRRKKSSG
ncbi:Smr/MutS family protein [Desulfococcaceae bacterium HSG8]|nr:Smr/MutS family protein [Desulfococcaceae bacterium HSG8]